MEFLERTNMLINTNSLKNKTIAIFGLGGVGCYVVEGLVRAGISSFILVDYDVISKTNINRHLLAFNETIGFKKTLLQKERILKIQPKAKIQIYDLMWNQETANQIDFTKIDFIVDAIDMVSSKILLIQWAKEKNIPIISCMGTGNRLNPFLFEITDISKTSVCPLAKTMRYELKKRNIHHVPVLYSKEVPSRHILTNEFGKHIPGSISFVPAVAGMCIASYIIKELCN